MATTKVTSAIRISTASLDVTGGGGGGGEHTSLMRSFQLSSDAPLSGTNVSFAAAESTRDDFYCTPLYRAESDA